MKVLSLFSGVGGFDMGLENAGMETVFQCEWDKNCRTILDRHWPTVPKWDDVSTLTGEHILAHAPVIDVVAWGSPCQDLSVAGKRAGLEGGRSGLFYEGIRIINELRKASNGKYPRISIWENVYGAINSNKGEDFEAILKEMVEAGSLLCEWRVLDAQYFGVPQRRRRVFVVAVFDPATANRCPDPLLPISEGLRWNPKTRTTTRQEPADTPTGSLGSSSQWAAGTSPKGDTLRTSVTSKWHKGSAGFSGSEYYNMVVESDLRDRESYAESSFAQFKEGDVAALKASGGVLGGGSETVLVETFTKSRRAQSATDNETWVEGKPAPTLNSFDQGDVRATTVIVNEPMLIDGRRVDDVRIYEEPVQTDENDPMFTLNTTDKHAVAYDEYNDALGGNVHHALRAGTKQSTGVIEPTMVVRRLTPLECERLMGWPDDHTRYKADGTEQADTHRYKQCGNGVASPVAQWIGEQLRDLDE